MVLLNSMQAVFGGNQVQLAKEMGDEIRSVRVMPVNCEQLKKGDIYHILERRS